MGYDSDNDNICGFDMDFDGDKDFIDDLIYDDITEYCNENKDSNFRGSGHSPVGTIICVVFGVATAISAGSITAGITGALVMWLIVLYFKHFVL